MKFKLAILFTFCLALTSLDARAQTTAAATADDEPAKSLGIKLKALDGKTYDTASMPGEVVVASFGATWCAPCIWELKAIEELMEEYNGKPVRFLWISIEDERRTPDGVLKKFAKQYRLTLPVMRDDGVTFAQFSDNRRIPFVIFFDTEGRFAAPAHRGMASEPIQYKQMVRRRVDALLAAAAQEPKAAGENKAAEGRTGAPPSQD
ncbi:MAG TPA: TlpA disulfide reductase family protein [Pyrinomonadaceae bacterium]